MIRRAKGTAPGEPSLASVRAFQDAGKQLGDKPGVFAYGNPGAASFTNTYQLQGSVTKVIGGHTIKAGADVRQINYLLQNTGDILSFSGDTTWTQRSNVPLILWSRS